MKITVELNENDLWNAESQDLLSLMLAAKGIAGSSREAVSAEKDNGDKVPVVPAVPEPEAAPESEKPEPEKKTGKSYYQRRKEAEAKKREAEKAQADKRETQEEPVKETPASPAQEAEKKAEKQEVPAEEKTENQEAPDEGKSEKQETPAEEKAEHAATEDSTDKPAAAEEPQGRNEPLTEEERKAISKKLKAIAGNGHALEIKDILAKHGLIKLSDASDDALKQILKEAEAL